jgi:hypothetical protein
MPPCSEGRWVKGGNLVKLSYNRKWYTIMKLIKVVARKFTKPQERAVLARRGKLNQRSARAFKTIYIAQGCWGVNRGSIMDLFNQTALDSLIHPFLSIANLRALCTWILVQDSKMTLTTSSLMW